jgi:hypothetical protein
MLVMYIKSKDLEVDDNRSSVCIPIMEPLHKIAQLAEKEKIKKEQKIISENQKMEEQQLKEKIDATLSIDLDDNKYEDEEDDYDSNFNCMSGSGYSSVGGVMMPSVSNMGSGVWGSNKNNCFSKGDWPSIGGLTLNSDGADKPKLKPVFLSSSTTTKICKVPISKKGISSPPYNENNNKKTIENPIKIEKEIISKQQVGIWDLSSTAPAPPVKGIGIVVTKENLLHALISQLSQYFAFVNSDGTVIISILYTCTIRSLFI